MSDEIKDSGLSNPFSTGGGGTTFEHLVGASYLVSLLACDIPMGMSCGVTKSVKFQHRWSGCIVDDVVVTVTDGTRDIRLALQIKHNLTFSESDQTFLKVMDDCWNTFNSAYGWSFDQETDRIGIGIGIYQGNISKHLQPLLEWARTSDSVEFFDKVSKPIFSSEEKQKYLEIIRRALAKSKNCDLTDEELWKFLRCFVVIHFDLENSGSGDTIHSWNRLLDQLETRNDSIARSLFDSLVRIVSEYSRSAGSIDRKTLVSNIPLSTAIKDPLSSSQSTESNKKELRELKETTTKILDNSLEQNSRISYIEEKISTVDQKVGSALGINIVDLSSAILASEYQAELEIAREFLRKCNPKQAFDYLQNFRNRIWHAANNIVKYEILTNMGSALLLLRQEQQAAKLSIEALQYNPEEDKALCNAALGHLLLDQIKGAEDLIQKALQKNPASAMAYSLIIQLSKDDEPAESILSKVPESYRETREVASALSDFYRKKKDLPNTMQWLRIAVKNDKDDLPDLKGALGSLIINAVLEDRTAFFVNQFSDSQQNQISEAIKLLDEVWNKIADTDLRKLRSEFIANRGFAKKLLGNIEDAIKDIDIALEIDPTNPLVIKNRALIAIESEDNEKAIKLLQIIITNEETPEASVTLAQVMKKEKKYSDGIDIAKTVIRGDYPESVKEEANRILIQLYIETNQLDKAKEISNEMRALDPVNILYLVDAADILISLKENDNALLLLRKAKENIKQSTTPRELLELADAFFELKQFDESTNIWEKILDKTINTPHTHKMIYAYYHSGQKDKVLEICSSLRQKYGPLLNITGMEVSIYEEIGDLSKARAVCLEYLQRFPDDFGNNLHLATLNFKSKNYLELDKFLDSSINIDALSLDYGIRLAELYVFRNKAKPALEIMYEIRKKYKDSPDAHLHYFTLFIHLERITKEMLITSIVNVDTAVCIQDDAEQKDWYVIVNREIPDFNNKEISLNHALAKKVMGKSIGDEIKLTENPIEARTGRIIEIKSKYVYALHDTLSTFEKLFPDAKGFYSIKFTKPEDMEKVKKVMTENYENFQVAEKLYKERGFTLGAFSNIIGKHIIETWGIRVNSQDLGIRCCIGNNEERGNALSLLKEKPRLTIDIISLLTIHVIKAHDFVVKAFGKLGIAQSTVDLLDFEIIQKRIFESGCMTIGKHEEDFVRQDISAEDIRQNISYLKAISEWVQQNCEVIPVKARLDLRHEIIEHLDKVFGASFVDTIFIAKESGSLLYSDDETLRAIAKSEYNIDGVWTQAVIMHCMNTGILSNLEYADMVIKLGCSYYYTSIDEKVLIEALRQSNWSQSPSYITLLGILNGSKTDEVSAINVATNFLYEFWEQIIIPPQFSAITFGILDAIMKERNVYETLPKLVTIVNGRTTILSSAKREIIAMLQKWSQIRKLYGQDNVSKMR